MVSDLKMYAPRLIHGLLEDDSDRCLQFSKNILSSELEGEGFSKQNCMVGRSKL